jgi:hypothetical protein
MKIPRDDPAERSGLLRYFYRNWRPTRLGRVYSSAIAWLSGAGLTPSILLTLQVSDRRNGDIQSTVLAVVEYRHERYLVSMLGDTSEWVQNIRAADGNAFVKRGAARPVKLIEIAIDLRAPILKAWCQIATSGRKHLPVAHDAPLSEFVKIAADYPVFRIDTAALTSNV